MFKVTVRIPSALQVHAAGLSEVRLSVDDDATVGELLEVLRAEHPGVVDRVLDEAGRQRRHVNVFVGPDSIRALSDLDTKVNPGADVTIMEGAAGG
jgi:molybdopterin synthase sulfur carrier subunit